MFRRAWPDRILSRRVAARNSERLNPRSTGGHMAASPTPEGDPLNVGIIADQSGPLSILGLANAHVARMVIGAINAKGGLLGRRLDLPPQDGATDDDVAAAAASNLVQ